MKQKSVKKQEVGIRVKKNDVFLSLSFATTQLPLISIAHLIRKLAGDAFSIFNESSQ